MEAHELAAALMASTTPPPEVSTECPHFDRPTPKEWCSRCSGIDEVSPTAPRIHDGRHGRNCRRCMGNYHRDLNKTRLKP